MPSTVKSVVGAAAAHTVTGLTSLASVTFAASAAAIDHTTNSPLDVEVEVTVNVGAHNGSGNKQIVVFAKASFDGTEFTSGPESGTSTTDEQNLYFLGTIPCASNSTWYRKTFSLAAAFGGVLPRASKIVIKNDTSVALAAGSGGTATGVKIAEVSGSIV